MSSSTSTTKHIERTVISHNYLHNGKDLLCKDREISITVQGQLLFVSSGDGKMNQHIRCKVKYSFGFFFASFTSSFIFITFPTFFSFLSFGKWSLSDVLSCWQKLLHSFSPIFWHISLNVLFSFIPLYLYFVQKSTTVRHFLSWHRFYNL